MAVLELVSWDDPILREKIEPYDFSKSDQDPVQLARDLAETMLSRGGVGLAANQAGLRHRAFVLWGSPIIPVFNPRLTDASTDTVLLEEACLSFPGLTVTVRRPKAIRVRFQVPNGQVITRRFEGMTARAFQHEMDHLDGVLFFADASRPKLDAAIRKAKKSGYPYSYSELMGKRKHAEAV